MGFFREGVVDRSQNFGGWVKAAVKYEMWCGVAMDDSTLMHNKMRCGVAMNDSKKMNILNERKKTFLFHDIDVPSPMQSYMQCIYHLFGFAIIPHRR